MVLTVVFDNGREITFSEQSTSKLEMERLINWYRNDNGSMTININCKAASGQTITFIIGRQHISYIKT